METPADARSSIPWNSASRESATPMNASMSMNAERVGRSKWELDTPALLVDLDLVDQNIATMATFFREAGVGWRPHCKGLKVPSLVHKEIAAGAIGATCAKLGEAEAMAAAGIKDILIANQVVGAIKVARLMKLLALADVMVAVDSLESAEELSAASHRAGRQLRVLVELDVGMNRAGVQPGEAAVDLSRKLQDLPGLRYMGLMAWEGHCGRVADATERKAACEYAVGLLLDSAELCRKAGLPVGIISCGGTETFQFTARIPGITEVQAGGGIFNDLHYASRGVAHPFALTILTTVTSRPTPTRIIVDAGRKSMSDGAAMPMPKDLSDLELVRLSAEHGKIEMQNPSGKPKIGDKLEWIVGYGDTTVCLHDEMVGIRSGKVEVVWPVLARGKVA